MRVVWGLFRAGGGGQGAAVDAPGKAAPDQRIEVPPHGGARRTKLEGELRCLDRAVLPEPLEDEPLALARKPRCRSGLVCAHCRSLDSRSASSARASGSPSLTAAVSGRWHSHRPAAPTGWAPTI